MNVCVFTGRFTRDPELRHTGSGVACTTFTLAVDRDYKSEDGRKADFADFVAWRGLAEFVSKYFHKGQMAAVVSKYQLGDWIDKDGNTHKKIEFIAEQVQFCAPKEKKQDDFVDDFAELRADDEDLPF